MKRSLPKRSQWLLWIAGVMSFLAVWLYPVSTLQTRSTGLILFSVLWISLIALCWQPRTARWCILALTILGIGFISLPDRRAPDIDSLRADYVAGMQRYMGARYYWGGESPKGIDCSGLVRRGLVDALFLRGFCTLHPALVRDAFWLWWHDTTADGLGHASGVFTVRLFDAPSINQLDHSKLEPGDLAVTQGGAHVLAYLGEKHWIEAEPEAQRVINVTSPRQDQVWFTIPVHLVRWKILSP